MFKIGFFLLTRTKIGHGTNENAHKKKKRCKSQKEIIDDRNAIERRMHLSLEKYLVGFSSD